MKALLWHRFSMQRHVLLSMVAVCILYYLLASFYLNGNSILTFTLILSISTFKNIFDQDKKASWRLFVNSLPLSKTQQLYADFSFCYGICLLLFTMAAPSYFLHYDISSSYIEHFSMFFAYVNCAIFNMGTQFYFNYQTNEADFQTLKTITFIIVSFAINFPIHYYLALVTSSFYIILIPTLCSVLVTILLFRKCIVFYNAQDIL